MSLFYDEAKTIDEIVSSSNIVVIIQADNPDADSLGSALALEEILGDLGKQTYLYCGVDMPEYLKYMSGWDRVNKDLPNKFDLSIIVDASTLSLLDKLTASNKLNWLKTRPCIVLDHHDIVENRIDFAGVVINDSTRASTGELIYCISKLLDWKLSVNSLNFITYSILGDTQGLSNQLATSATYRIVADMIDAGIDRAKLEEKRREYNRMSRDIYRYKAELIKRTEFDPSGEIAYVSIPQPEINLYSPQYNPAPLIQPDMLQTAGVRLAIVFKVYGDNKVTAALRSNPSAGISAKLAEQFGGGGHKFASGFKQENVTDPSKLIADCVASAIKILGS